MEKYKICGFNHFLRLSLFTMFFSCNYNSISPPVSIIGVLGGDHLLSNILRAYVHLLQDKVFKLLFF